MPYVKKEARQYINALSRADGPGELNFELTSIVIDYIGDVRAYTKYNEVIGVLECMKLELYRRMVAPYEDRKCAENGDVYDKTT